MSIFAFQWIGHTHKRIMKVALKERILPPTLKQNKSGRFSCKARKEAEATIRALSAGSEGNYVFDVLKEALLGELSIGGTMKAIASRILARERAEASSSSSREVPAAVTVTTTSSVNSPAPAVAVAAPSVDPAQKAKNAQERKERKERRKSAEAGAAKASVDSVREDEQGTAAESSTETSKKRRKIDKEAAKTQASERLRAAITDKASFSLLTPEMQKILLDKYMASLL
jgi:hypothetical protein